MSKAIEVDTKTFLRFWLVMAGLLLVLWFVAQAMTGLIIVGLSIFLAVAIRPLVKKVSSIGSKNRQGLSAGITVGGIVLVLAAVIAIVGPVVISETGRFISQAPAQIESSFGGWDGINEFGKTFGIDNAKDQIMTMIRNLSQSIISGFSSSVVSSMGTVLNFLSGAILVIVLTILFSTQGPELLNKFWGVMGKKDSKKAAAAQRITNKIADVISKYMSGQVAVALLDGMVVGVAVFVLSLIFGFSSGLTFPMAMIAMVFYLIPMFGPLITAVLVTLLLFFSSPAGAAAFIIFYGIYAEIENNVIAPKVQSNSLKLPTLVILVAITIGVYMFGLVGAIISIPIAGIIKVLIDEYPNLKELSE